jgi:XRE family transcriptional regulator, aerobic/anaerobic benzoate catabolism transcriptional regulator
LRQTCHTVWLRATAQEHYRRVVAQGDLRPMQDRPKAMAELEALLAEREADYARAEHVIATSARSVEEIVDELVARAR